MLIYKITNKENGKLYIGQTRDWKRRYSAYRSAPFNPKSSEYNRPISRAIRKYGLEGFSFDIVEELEGETQEFLDEREMFFIQHYNSLTSGNGYNVQLGGQGTERVKATYEERIAQSTLFSAEEIKEIQGRLMADEDYSKILARFPLLSRTFLSNINVGLAFTNPEWEYPLKKDHHKSRYSKEEIAEIKEMIRKGIDYSLIQKMFDIKSKGFISLINTGKNFFDANESYPLFRPRSGPYMAKEAQKMMIENDWSSYPTKATIYAFIAQKVGYRQLTSLKRIDFGDTHFNEKFKYPLLNNQEYNQKQ